MDPLLQWRGTQTIWPFDQDHLFILTHLEWSRRQGNQLALKSRTNARYFDNSMVFYDRCIRGRQLTEQQVWEVNYILKARAHRYIAGRSEDDLFPERYMKTTMWNKLGQFLLPKSNPMGRSGKMFAVMRDGSVYTQDEFGRRPQSKAEYDAAVAEVMRLKADMDRALAKYHAGKTE